MNWCWRRSSGKVKWLVVVATLHERIQLLIHVCSIVDKMRIDMTMRWSEESMTGNAAMS